MLLHTSCLGSLCLDISTLYLLPSHSLRSFIFLTDRTFLLHLIYPSKMDSGPDKAVEASKALKGLGGMLTQKVCSLLQSSSRSSSSLVARLSDDLAVGRLTVRRERESKQT